MQDSPPTAGDILLSCFDSDPVIAGERLLRCRQKLIRRFSAERCRDVEDLANDTLKRALAWLEKNPESLKAPVEHIISAIATNVLREYWRSAIHTEDPLEAMSPADEPRTNPLDNLLNDLSKQEDLRRCLKQCLGQLNSDERSLLIRYYTVAPGDKAKFARRALASSSGLTAAQLRKAAFKLRLQLEGYSRECLDKYALTVRNKTEE